MKKFITAHVIKNYSLTCPNRGENGEVKSFTFNGKSRACISSQCLNYYLREKMENTTFSADFSGRYLSHRTRRLCDILTEKLSFVDEKDRQDYTEIIASIYGKTEKPKKGQKKDNEEIVSEAEGEEGAEDISSSKNMSSFSEKEIDYLVSLVRNNIDEKKSIDEFTKFIVTDKGKGTINPKIAKQLQNRISIDVAVFGRMIASNQNLGVRGAASCSYAMSTNAMIENIDFFSAVDTYNTKHNIPGAGHTDTQSATSACYYSNMTIDTIKLAENLQCSQELATEIAMVYLKEFTLTNPKGKSKSMSTDVLPSVVLLVASDTQPATLTNAFSKPVDSWKGYIQDSASKMVSFYKNNISRWGQFDGQSCIVYDPDISIDDELKDTGIVIYGSLDQMFTQS